MRKLLQIGSIVLLDNGTKNLMIFGRFQQDTRTGEVYDYSGCFYPEGLLGNGNLFLFNDEDINTLVFAGYEDEEEINFQLYI